MSKSVNKTGEIIKMERKRLKLSQEDLGEMLGCCRQLVGSWENGAPIHDEYFYIEMSKIFDCDIDYLKGLQAEPHRSQTDIKAVTGLNEKTIQALAELYKRSSDNTGFSEIARNRLTTINTLLVGLLSNPRDSLLDNMYNILCTHSRIKEIESSDLFNISEADIVQSFFDDPDKYDDLNNRIRECHINLNEQREKLDRYKSVFKDSVDKEIDKRLI